MLRPRPSVAFDHIPAVGLIVDLEGTVLAVNEAGCAALQRPANELEGRAIRTLFCAGADKLLASSGTVHEVQFEIGERRRTLQCAVSSFDWEGQSVRQVIGFDISSRLAADEQSAANQRLESLGIVAGGVARDFNNLLVGVLAEASAAREEAALSIATLESLRRIEAAAQRMAQLTRLMLAYAGRGQAVVQRLDPDDLMRDMREVLARSVRPDVHVEVTADAGPVVIQADPGQIRTLLINLVANASDAGSHRVTVTSRVRIRDDGASWQLEVSDDGQGIAPASLGRIFEPFFTTKLDRRGLGLSAVQGIVRQLGGHIEVTSPPGMGARFSVRLPILPGAEAQRRPSSQGMSPIARVAELRVLVADDEPSVRATVRRLLERRGAKVVVVNDGEEAEAALRAQVFDLAVVDVSMPGRGGYDVLETARKTRPEMPVILMSGYTNRVRGEGGEEEPDAFLEKPFTSRVLDAAIDRVLKDKGQCEERSAIKAVP